MKTFFLIVTHPFTPPNGGE